MSEIKILAIGEDDGLLVSRVAILQRRYKASHAHSRLAMQVLKEEHFDLLLVCHSTPFEIANALIREAHGEFPALRIVRLRTVETPDIPKPVADIVVTIDHQPATWIKAVDKLLASSAGQAGS